MLRHIHLQLVILLHNSVFLCLQPSIAMIKFLNLPFPRKKLLLTSVFLSMAIWLGLRVRPLRVVVQYVQTAPANSKTTHTLADIIWAIRAIDRRFSHATCLVNGLAGQYLLTRNQIASQLCIGVKKETTELKAHAWVVVDGQIVIGSIPELDTYIPLPSLNIAP